MKDFESLKAVHGDFSAYLFMLKVCYYGIYGREIEYLEEDSENKPLEKYANLMFIEWKEDIDKSRINKKFNTSYLVGRGYKAINTPQYLFISKVFEDSNNNVDSFDEWCDSNNEKYEQLSSDYSYMWHEDFVEYFNTWKNENSR